MLVTDYRRTDLRSNVLENPYWITSALVSGTEVEAATKGATITGTGIAAVSSTTDTITDTGSGFTTAGFLDGDVIAVSGFTGETGNNTFWTLASSGGVADGTLTLVETTLATDAAGESVTIITPNANVLFSFPDVEYVIVQEVVVEIVAAFTANTKVTLGIGTLATDAVTTGGVITNTDFDRFVRSADITATSIAKYSSAASAWGVDKLAGTWTTNRYILGAATDVPAVYVAIANMTNAAPAAIAAGSLRVHMLISVKP